MRRSNSLWRPSACARLLSSIRRSTRLRWPFAAVSMIWKYWWTKSQRQRPRRDTVQMIQSSSAPRRIASSTLQSVM